MVARLEKCRHWSEQMISDHAFATVLSSLLEITAKNTLFCSLFHPVWNSTKKYVSSWLCYRKAQRPIVECPVSGGWNRLNGSYIRWTSGRGSWPTGTYFSYWLIRICSYSQLKVYKYTEVMACIAETIWRNRCDPIQCRCRILYTLHYSN